ncbi:MAG: hypothetical protein DMG05_27510 [Acidobacteria bacterium]|nr:MAG: hypothetical protein DMG05_27510 [Acidobacteriota bacterium]
MKDRGCARFNSPLFSAGLEFGYFRTKERLGPSPDASRHPLPQGEGESQDDAVTESAVSFQQDGKPATKRFFQPFRSHH